MSSGSKGSSGSNGAGSPNSSGGSSAPIDVLALPFDQYQRYRLVAELVDELHPRDKATKPLRILDVGGRTALLRSFLPQELVTLVDIEPSDERPLVLGDGARLPFADQSFDLVCAFDTLEHVPPPLRNAFVAECARVARRHVILAGPYQTRAVEEAERILQQFLKDKLAVEHRYLEEHRHNGLPDRGAVEAQLQGLGARVRSIAHGNLERWLALICMSMYMDYRPELRGIASRFQRFYNARLYESDHTPPCYRHAVVAAFADAPLPRAERFQAPVSAPQGATSRLSELAFELVDFERAHEASQKERAGLRETVSTLEEDLAGHKRSLEESLERQSEQAESIATLAADLEEHKKSVADLQRDVAAERERFTKLAAEAREEKRTLEADLAQHKDVVQKLEAELAEHKGVLAQVRALAEGYAAEIERMLALREAERVAFERVQKDLEARVSELARELDATREALGAQTEARKGLDLALDDAKRDLSEHKKSLAALARDLDEHRRVLGATEAEVRARGEAIAGLTSDLEAHRTALTLRERELGEHRQVIGALEQDLSGHRAVVATLRAEEAALRAELERQTNARNQSDQELADARAQIARAAADLARQHELIELLRAHLRSRWKGFQRALGPRKPTP